MLLLLYRPDVSRTFRLSQARILDTLMRFAPMTRHMYTLRKGLDHDAFPPPLDVAPWNPVRV